MSYAASFSVEYISDADKEFVKGMLAKMNRISVREYQGVDILKSLDIKNGVKVLDPVFLLDRNYWETFMHKGSEKEDSSLILQKCNKSYRSTSKNSL